MDVLDVRALIERHAALPRASAPRLVIGIVGVPGSGKTTLSASLVAAADAAAGEAGAGVALSMDGFHLTLAELASRRDAAAALVRRGSPWTFAAARLAASIVAVRGGGDGGGSVAWPSFDHAVGDPVPGAIVVPPLPLARVVVIEGLYLLHDADGWGAVGRAANAKRRCTRSTMTATVATPARCMTCTIVRTPCATMARSATRRARRAACCSDTSAGPRCSTRTPCAPREDDCDELPLTTTRRRHTSATHGDAQQQEERLPGREREKQRR